MKNQSIIFLALKKLGLSEISIKNIANNWYNEQMKNSKDHELSVESELLLGIFNQIFKKIVGDKVVYSQDYREFAYLMNWVVANYEYSDPKDNIFYQILTAFKEEKMEIIFDKSEDKSQDQVLKLIEISGNKNNILEIVDNKKELLIEEETKELVIKKGEFGIFNEPVINLNQNQMLTLKGIEATGELEIIKNNRNDKEELKIMIIEKEIIEIVVNEEVIKTRELIKQLNNMNAIMQLDEFIVKNGVLDLTLLGESNTPIIFDLIDKAQGVFMTHVADKITNNPKIKVNWQQQDNEGNTALMKLYQATLSELTLKEFALDPITFILFSDLDHMTEIAKGLSGILTPEHLKMYHEIFPIGQIEVEQI